MKSLIIKVAILIMVMGVVNENTFAKNKMVPTAVQTAFTAKYSQAHLKKWKTKADTSIAIFVLNNRKYEATYANDGNWVSTKRDVKHFSSLPLTTQKFLKNSKYASWNIDGMQKVQTPAQTMYVVLIDNHSGSKSEYEGVGAGASKMLCFDNSGRLIKAE